MLTESGRRISVVSHRDGERDLALFDAEDPDASTDSISLTDDEAAALADVLGASLTLSRLSGLGDQAMGLFTEEVSLPTDSKFVGRTMGTTRARTLTSSSIVAIRRGTQVLPSPKPDFVFEPGDVIVAVGTRSGLDALSRIISHGPS